MQSPTNWCKQTGRFVYELANGTTHELVSFSPIFANQTAALNSLRLRFHLTPASESLTKISIHILALNPQRRPNPSSEQYLHTLILLSRVD